MSGFFSKKNQGRLLGAITAIILGIWALSVERDTDTGLDPTLSGELTRTPSLFLAAGIALILFGLYLLYRLYRSSKDRPQPPKAPSSHLNGDHTNDHHRPPRHPPVS